MRTEIHGRAEDGYGPVADAFAKNFVLRDELGAAVATYVAALVAALGTCLRA
jgi:hypothetical protein